MPQSRDFIAIHRARARARTDTPLNVITKRRSNNLACRGAKGTRNDEKASPASGCESSAGTVITRLPAPAR